MHSRPKIYAKLWSHKRKRRSNRTKPQLSAIRIAELNRLFTARHGEQLPNNGIGRDAALIVAQHLVELSGHPLDRLMSWATDRAPWLTIAELKDIVGTVMQEPKRWKADTLAWRLRLTYADRQALKITTIGAIDCSKAQREAKRRAAARKRAKASYERRKLARVCAP